MFEYFVYCYGNQFIGLILCAIFALLALAAKRFLDDETKRKIAKTGVAYVQQIYKLLDGPAKMDKFLEYVEQELKERHIKFSATQMRALGEAALAEFKKVFEQAEPLTGSGNADGTYRVPETVE